jgi:hypothetical protein
VTVRAAPWKAIFIIEFLFYEPGNGAKPNFIGVAHLYSGNFSAFF